MESLNLVGRNSSLVCASDEFRNGNTYVIHFGAHQINIISECNFLIKGLIALTQRTISDNCLAQKIVFIDERMLLNFHWESRAAEFVGWKIIYIKGKKSTSHRFEMSILSIDATLSNWELQLSKITANWTGETGVFSRAQTKPLTLRESQIFDLLKKNLSIKQISNTLHLNVKTVYCYRKNIVKKFHCDNTLHLFMVISGNSAVDCFSAERLLS